MAVFVSRSKNLDTVARLNIMQSFLMRPRLMTLVAFRRSRFPKPLRTKSHFGAKSTPNTPYSTQEIK
jgi:hypothetical protein